MSEYQYIEFKAIDRPLTDKELEYAETQSSRAEITKWSFANEYHYSEFRGKKQELLRRGYDIYLEYANYGTRTIMMRFPAGLPFPQAVLSKYIDGERIQWIADKQGPGGILSIRPFIEEIEEIWDVQNCLDEIAPVRNELIGGDLRTLYGAWLCCVYDANSAPNEFELPPLPAGIGQASPACHALLEFYDTDPLMLQAAAEEALPCPEATGAEVSVARWLESLSEQEVRQRLSTFLLGDLAQVKAETVHEIREAFEPPIWPTSADSRTVEQLRQRTEQLREAEIAREKAKAQAQAKRDAQQQEKARQDRMRLMSKEPQKWLKQADELVANRGTVNYKAAAEILADLGEALGDEQGTKLVRQHAAHLAKKHPTLSHLKSSLRKRGLIG